MHGGGSRRDIGRGGRRDRSVRSHPAVVRTVRRIERIWDSSSGEIAELLEAVMAERVSFCRKKDYCEDGHCSDCIERWLLEEGEINA